jgi:hypothetical protein
MKHPLEEFNNTMCERAKHCLYSRLSATPLCLGYERKIKAFRVYEHVIKDANIHIFLYC